MSADKPSMKPMTQPGYYPGFSTLEQRPHWDEATAKKIEERLETKTIRFFTPEEAATMQAMLDCVMPQDDRAETHKIPVLALIDKRLFEKKFDGYIFEGTVEDDVAHRTALPCIEAMAEAQYTKSFRRLSLPEQETLLLSLRDGKPGPAWTCDATVPAKHYWGVLMKDAATAYYSHPFAWDEIGFGGPAYPRGYMRLTGGFPEPWEKDEQRYEWKAPEGSRSDDLRANENLFPQSHLSSPSQSSSEPNKK